MKPLEGLKVVELARILAGPWIGQSLADLGAEVIKVEAPQGDDTRTWGPPFIERDGDKTAAYFYAANRGKTSVIADFRTPEGDYFLTRRLIESDFFMAIEVSYPNETDAARAQKRGVRPGGLIMIHGQPVEPKKSAGYYAKFDWTDGCIAVSNEAMVEIWQRTRVNTPITVLP